MKIMVISDTHSDTFYLTKAINIFHEYNFDKLLHLGDIGKDSINLLNSIYSKVKAVKGNNDFSFLLKDIKFNIESVINYETINNKLIVFSHGHLYNGYNYNKDYDIFLSGHTHTSSLLKYNNKIIANPGSISCPRDNINSYIEINDKFIKIIDINRNKIIKQEEI